MQQIVFFKIYLRGHLLLLTKNLSPIKKSKHFSVHVVLTYCVLLKSHYFQKYSNPFYISNAMPLSQLPSLCHHTPVSRCLYFFLCTMFDAILLMQFYKISLLIYIVVQADPLPPGFISTQQLTSTLALASQFLIKAAYVESSVLSVINLIACMVLYGIMICELQ